MIFLVGGGSILTKVVFAILPRGNSFAEGWLKNENFLLLCFVMAFIK